jgi:hypothetical protein
MAARVRVEVRRFTDSVAFQGELEETVILRDGKLVAALPEGDPLRYVLELSVEELCSMKEDLAPVLERKPRVREVVEALIEYKEEQRQEREHQTTSGESILR